MQGQRVPLRVMWKQCLRCGEAVDTHAPQRAPKGLVVGLLEHASANFFCKESASLGFAGHIVGHIIFVDSCAWFWSSSSSSSTSSSSSSSSFITL